MGLTGMVVILAVGALLVPECFLLGVSFEDNFEAKTIMVQFLS